MVFLTNKNVITARQYIQRPTQKFGQGQLACLPEQSVVTDNGIFHDATGPEIINEFLMYIR